MKRLLLSLFIMFVLTVQPALQARPKLYYYDGDVPMIEMMLNMMVVMGMIDKVPPQLLRNGGIGSLYGSNGNFSRFSRNPWLRGWSGGLPGGMSGFGPMQNWGNYALPGNFNRYGGSNIFNCANRSCLGPTALDGVWISSTGDMLGIKGRQIIWSDGGSSYNSGVFRATQDLLLVHLNGANANLPYRYQLHGNQLNLKDSQGVLRRFHRLPGSNFY